MRVHILIRKHRLQGMFVWITKKDKNIRICYIYIP
jgi:hypothetical protein